MISRSILLRFITMLVVITKTFAEFEDIPTWTVQVVEGSSVKLTCNGSDVMLVNDADTKVEWAPVDIGKKGKTILWNTEGFKLESLNGVPNGILIIEKVDASNSGTYICIVMKNNEVKKVALRGVNVHSAAYESLTDKYKTGVITGAIAAAVCFVILVVPCVIYKCRYISPEERERKKLRESHDLSVEVPTKKGYDNTMFANESTQL